MAGEDLARDLAALEARARLSLACCAAVLSMQRGFQKLEHSLQLLSVQLDTRVAALEKRLSMPWHGLLNPKFGVRNARLCKALAQ